MTAVRYNRLLVLVVLVAVVVVMFVLDVTILLECVVLTVKFAVWWCRSGCGCDGGAIPGEGWEVIEMMGDVAVVVAVSVDELPVPIVLEV